LVHTDLHIPEVAFKGLCYAIKLKLEFAVLSKLVEVAGGRKSGREFADALESGHSDDYTDISRTQSDPAFMVDPSRRAATRKVTSPASLPSSNRFDWVEGLEKVDSTPLDVNAKTSYEGTMRFGHQNNMKQPGDGSAYEYSLPHQTAQPRWRRESNITYAQMISELAKPD
jgi:hypothetical protein